MKNADFGQFDVDGQPRPINGFFDGTGDPVNPFVHAMNDFFNGGQSGNGRDFNYDFDLAFASAGRRVGIRGRTRRTRHTGSTGVGGVGDFPAPVTGSTSASGARLSRRRRLARWWRARLRRNGMRGLCGRVAS